jgi:putative transcriptional regulator
VINVAVVNKLKTILAEKGIKQSWICDQLGLSSSTVSNLINNRHQTNIEIAFSISDLLNMRIDEIFIYTRDK